MPKGCEDCGGAALAEATPRTPQIERENEISKKEGKEERKKKFVKKVSGYKGTRRS